MTVQSVDLLSPILFPPGTFTHQGLACFHTDGRANIDIPFEELEMDTQIGGGVWIVGCKL